mgnify:CR=1 FL=1
MAWQQVLKSYALEEFILKDSTKKAKKGSAEETLDSGDKVRVITTSSLNQIKKEITSWFNTCRSKTLDSIGVTGKHGSRSLLEHITRHIDSAYQRAGQPERQGAMDIIDAVMEMISDVHAFKTKELLAIEDFIEDLEEIERDSKTNPRNIPFTVPKSLTADGVDEWETVYGHYRTPKYVEYRTEVKGKNEPNVEMGDDWIKRSPDSAKPPFWQALFADGDGDVIATGLLPLLRKLEQEIEEQPLENLEIKGRGQRELLQQVPAVIKTMQVILKDQSVYHSATAPFKRLQINFNAYRRKLMETKFMIDPNDEKLSDLVLRVSGNADLAGQLESFYIQGISNRLIRTIISNLQEINLDTFKHDGKTGIFLFDAARVQEKRKALFNAELKRAKQEGLTIPRWALPDEPPEGGGNVKKAWSQYLWRDYL